jgi:hypothetical protein
VRGETLPKTVGRDRVSLISLFQELSSLACTAEELLLKADYMRIEANIDEGRLQKNQVRNA